MALCTGVLCAGLSFGLWSTVEVEFHVRSFANDVSNIAQSTPTRVAHIVIRLDPRLWKLQDRTFLQAIAATKPHISSLPGLQLLVFETKHRSTAIEDLANKFRDIRVGTTVYTRTCKQAQEVVDHARRNASYATDHHIASPLWYLDDKEPNQIRWCVHLLVFRVGYIQSERIAPSIRIMDDYVDEGSSG